MGNDIYGGAKCKSIPGGNLIIIIMLIIIIFTNIHYHNFIVY